MNVPKVILCEIDHFLTGPTKVATPLPFGHLVTRLLDLCTADFRGRRYHVPPAEEHDASLDFYDRSRWNRSVHPMLARQHAATDAPTIPPPPVAEDFHFGYLEYQNLMSGMEGLRVDHERLRVQAATLHANQAFSYEQMVAMNLVSHRQHYDSQGLLHSLLQLDPLSPYQAPVYPSFPGTSTSHGDGVDGGGSDE